MNNNAINLNHYQFVRVSGGDAISFLQGQISANTELLSPQESLHAALCNLKGRVIADFRVLKHGDDCLLQTVAGMATPVIETLSKYAVFSDVEITLDQQGVSAIGFIAENCPPFLTTIFGTCPLLENQLEQTSDMSLIKIAAGSGRFELWFHSADARTRFFNAGKFALDDNLDAWNRETLSAGIVHITPELSEKYTPQLLNYDISGVIDFNKGCYTGQEVVARMFYRGQAKKRLFLASSSHAVSGHSEIVIADEARSNVGEILKFSNAQGSGEGPNLLLAVVNTAAVEEKAALSLSDQGESVVEIEQLPYID